jgi:hypothetical protein
LKFDEKNVVIKNFLTDYEIDDLLNSIKKPYKQYVMDLFVQQITDFRMPEKIEQKIISHIEKITGLSGFEMEYQFSRYELLNANGEVAMPNLTPHFDGFEQPRITFDYQLNSNTSWPIYVEGKEFVLKNNEALTFSGTHQVHWRSPKDFSEGEFVEMIFCHLYLKDNGAQLGADHTKLMSDRSEEWRLKLEAANG